MAERGPKFQKGACENCGSSKHKRKDCLERPRKHKAKYYNNKITEDNYEYQPKADKIKENFLEKPAPYTNKYEEKRDQWGEQDLENYELMLKEKQMEKEIKKQMGIEETDEAFKQKLDITNTDPDMDTRERTAHSFRDRNQIPHYLASYIKDHEKDKKLEFNDTYMKYTGDSKKLLEQERFAMKNKVTDSVALPTTTELMFKRENEKLKLRQQDELSAIEKLYGIDQVKQEDKVEVIYEADLIAERESNREEEDTVKRTKKIKKHKQTD